MQDSYSLLLRISQVFPDMNTAYFILHGRPAGLVFELCNLLALLRSFSNHTVAHMRELSSIFLLLDTLHQR
uniref:Uncharacterized protein n=1 Tax=Arundo donax TaxID=35708 RepID=A0A0A9DE10_ARUDO